LTVALVLLGAGRATADPYGAYPPGYCPPVVSYAAPAPVVSYYAPAPVVSYYAPAPVVSYYAVPRASYYYAPAVSYYSPAVSYYAPSAVTTTRYGLFGRPRVSTTYYGP